MRNENWKNTAFRNDNWKFPVKGKGKKIFVVRYGNNKISFCYCVQNFPGIPLLGNIFPIDLFPIMGIYSEKMKSFTLAYIYHIYFILGSEKFPSVDANPGYIWCCLRSSLYHSIRNTQRLWKVIIGAPCHFYTSILPWTRTIIFEKMFKPFERNVFFSEMRLVY